MSIISPVVLALGTMVMVAVGEGGLSFGRATEAKVFLAVVACHMVTLVILATELQTIRTGHDDHARVLLLHDLYHFFPSGARTPMLLFETQSAVAASATNAHDVLTLNVVKWDE